jgi:hypothetical protein
VERLLTDAEVAEIREKAARETRPRLLRDLIDRLLGDRDIRRSLEKKGKAQG